MKAWCKAAAIAKRVAIQTGQHEKGRRYGRLMKAVGAGAKFVASPSPLFFRLCYHAGILTLSNQDGATV